MVIHVVGCFWMASTEANLRSYDVWIAANGLIDSNMYEQYVAAIYWATVTCTTVGYGDITPTNYIEVSWAMIAIIFGVAIFAYIISTLSTQFSEILSNNVEA
jgi:hypothetical protein